jgi:predicted restriction endonuclease
VKDKELRRTYRFKACVICMKRGCDPSHVKSYGSTGIDEEWNIIPLCRVHHSEWHQRGALSTTEKYPRLKDHLISLGWSFLSGKLFHPNQRR